MELGAAVGVGVGVSNRTDGVVDADAEWVLLLPPTLDPIPVPVPVPDP